MMMDLKSRKGEEMLLLSLFMVHVWYGIVGKQEWSESVFLLWWKGDGV